MTIDEAIDELRNQCCVPNNEFQKPKYQARALGLEALKRFRKLRSVLKLPYTEPLPGEDSQ